MSRLARATLAFALVCIATPARAGDEPQFGGPDVYTSRADSPFSLGTVGICIEDFEDGVLNLPAVAGNGTIVNPAGNADSVDGDDGTIDGSGNGGHSYFRANGPEGISFTFDPFYGNGLPFAVGIVWTDGGTSATVTFEAFGPSGLSLGTNGPNAHADASNSGTTGEDRFYFIHNIFGVSAIKISNSSGGIEVDHLQFDSCFICGEASGDQKIQAVDALVTLKTAVNSASCELCVCDVNESGSVTAVDALVLLKHAVGQGVNLNCPMCFDTE